MPNLEDPLEALLDLEDSGADTFLEGIQGNIIKGHGRDFTRHLLQSNLHQFVLQQGGSDSNDFVKPGVGFDAVIGQHHGGGAPAPIEQTWPTSTGAVRFKMVNFVRMHGGEYFFAPSMCFLRGLAQP